LISIQRSGNNYFLNGLTDVDIIDSIDNVTSYYVQGYERSDKFQAGTWDGKEHLMRRSKNGSYYVPFGLIDEVKSILNIWGVNFELKTENYFEGHIHAIESGVLDGIELRPYQVEALKKLVLTCNNASGVIALPTGSGKTILSLYWAKVLNIPFMVLVHRVELLRQWGEEIEKHFGYKPTLIGNGGRIEGDPRATVAMVQTLSAKMKSETPDRREKIETGLLIADELHIIAAKTFYSVAMSIDAKYRLGLSATPTRSDGAELKIFACCGMIASSIKVEDLVESGSLAKPLFRLEKLPSCKMKWSSSFTEVYKQGIVNNFERNERIMQIADEYLSKGRQVYIHVNYIQHGLILQGMIKDAIFVHGSTKKDERKQTIQDYKDGKIRCLISTLLKEGVSIDGITCLVYAAGGKSEVSLIQTIGRALRIDVVFGDAIIIDFIDSGHRFIENHVQSRISAYRETYGDLFQY
jgi:superfamily II DNA or RNA helicase